MNGPDWLRAQLTSFTCPACGRRYRDGTINLLAERDGLYFVDLDCGRCGSHTVAIVTVEQDDAESAIADVSDALADPREQLGEPLPVAAAPVTADDVLEMHEFLSSFHGDVGALFRAAWRPRGGVERR
jgi:transcription elongation factor Elf1